jgi:alpha/beta hydrolase fold
LRWVETSSRSDAGVLNIGYAEAGPSSGSPVILLHGWPYDTHDYIEVAPILAAQGYRVIVPHLRGHGSTRFLDPATPRAGQQAAVGVDVIALMDALNIPNRGVSRLRLGRPSCVHRRGALAEALHRAGFGQRLSHSGHRAPSGLNSISRRSGVALGWLPIETISRACCGPMKIPPGTTTMRPSSEASLHGKIQIMSMW